VLRGRKRIIFLPPNASASLLPTVIGPSIAPYAKDFGVVVDIGKRGYADVSQPLPQLPRALSCSQSESLLLTDPNAYIVLSFSGRTLRCVLILRRRVPCWSPS
jgi:hypothetical protein